MGKKNRTTAWFPRYPKLKKKEEMSEIELIEHEEKNRRIIRDRHFANYQEWLGRRGRKEDMLCLQCRRVAHCPCNAPRMDLFVKDRMPKRSASKKRWKEFFEYKQGRCRDIGAYDENGEHTRVTVQQAIDLYKEDKNVSIHRKPN